LSAIKIVLTGLLMIEFGLGIDSYRPPAAAGVSLRITRNFWS